ncbi:hypothetical protein [Carboxylicivirga sp. N1Y90]|uniref:hypothetical protein n=1 Tax=Carboxylicivirga fragile TaxID=3417571 RepID=UPI003D352649|nr:hypothetical protein [Marinilabiliaceae bacterium N1Y90]
MAKEKMNNETLTLGEFYKKLFFTIRELVFTPRKAWTIIWSEKTGLNDVLKYFSLPLIGAFTLATFLGYIFNHQGVDFELALKYAIFTFSACFFGLYLAYIVILNVLPFLGLKLEKDDAFKIAAYPSVSIYLVGIVTVLFPETFFLSFLMLYAAYIVWEAICELGNASKETRFWQTISVSALVLSLPYLVYFLLIRLSGFTFNL